MARHKDGQRLRILFTAGMLALGTMIAANPASAVFSGEASQMFNGRWVFDADGSNKFLTYGTDANTFTKLSGGFCHEQTGLALGVNVNMNTDNNTISETKQLMGYLGYKKTYLRYQSGAMKGTYQWAGSLAPGMVRDGKFDQDFTHVDVLFWKRLFGMPGFIGLGYTTYSMPVEVRTLYTASDKAHQKNGVFVYDPEFKANFYSFLFGFDTFSEALASMEGALSSKKGFGVYFSGEDRIGFGSSQMSKAAVEHAMALNPGLKPVTESFVSAIVENDTSLGIRWFSPGGGVGIGLGYEVSFIANFNFSGAAERPGDLGFDIYSSMLRHGPVARVLVKW